MQYYHFFIFLIHFIFNFSIINLILINYLNLLIYCLINQYHFDIFLFLKYVFKLIVIFMQNYQFLFYHVHFIFNYLIIINNFFLNLILKFILYYHFFIYPIHFIFNFSLIKFIHLINFNQLFNYFIYLSHFDIYQYLIYVLNLTNKCRRYYRSFINQDHFIFNYFIILNIRILNLIVIFKETMA